MVGKSNTTVYIYNKMKISKLYL